MSDPATGSLPPGPEQTLRAVFEGIAGASGDAFFTSLGHHLARAMNARFALITECTDASRSRVRSLAFWTGDDFGEPFEYDVAGAPCADVLLRNEVRFYPHGVRGLFPRDRDLERLGIESYLGAPIPDSAGEVVGHLAAMDVEPMPADVRREWLLRIFASRAGAEIERKRVEQNLSESEAKYRTLVEQIPAATYIGELNPDCSASYTSPPIEAMTGFTPEEWCAGPSRWRRQLHPDDRDAVVGELTRCLAARRPFRAEYRLRTKDGRTIWISDQGQAVPDDAGRPLFFQGVMLDITAQKRMELELLQNQKLESLCLLAGGVAHDFNNLLTGILGNTSLALKELDEGPLREKLQRVEEAAVRAADLTRQMLAYTGRGRLAIEPLDLNELVAEMQHLLASVVSRKAELRDELDRSIPLIEADATQIRQLVLNLITNASDALGDAGGTITLTTGAPGPADPAAGSAPRVYLEVRDSGCGMDPQTLQRMFDPFFSTKPSGRGLGLAAVQGVVRGHGGELHVDSAPGRGTTIRVLFPATNRRARPRKPVAAAPRARGCGTILVVDDEESVRDVARSILAKLGFSAITAADGVEGLELYRRHAQRIVGVLLDLSMPRMDGEETFRQIRQLDAELPVLMMSGYDERQSLSRLAQRDRTAFLQKPYTVEELTDKLFGVLQTSPAP